ncbi:YitT family protein [Thalassobacillus sp. C254]|uniref:YitT family protein n=1 Tax=Thalassobacillus sp. C254 TaxID=1225341 RepID=UPI0006D2167D|nr:YitT family protein [Thalassobacillus sp. C254]
MKSLLVTALWLTGGAVLQGTAMALFLFPYDIPSGGAAGVTILFHHWFSFPHEYTLWGLNAVMLAGACRWIGVKSALKTLYTVSAASFSIFLLSSYVRFDSFPGMISIPAGALLFGLGVGLLYCKGASSGGFAILAHIIYRLSGVLPGRPLFWMNMSIFLLLAIVIDVWVFFVALLTQWISTSLINVTVRTYEKSSKEKYNNDYLPT